MEPEELIVNEDSRTNDRLVVELYQEIEITPESIAEHLANVSEE